MAHGPAAGVPLETPLSRQCPQAANSVQILPFAPLPVRYDVTEELASIRASDRRVQQDADGGANDADN